MAAKAKAVYLCTDCGHESPKWLGKCPACGAWNTLAEHRVQEAAKTRTLSARLEGDQKPVALSAISGERELRVSTGIPELDRVLGGGMVVGSLLLLSGEPGIGKSTLLLQASESLCRQMPVLYITGEESLPQIKLRADRLGISAENVYIYSETQLDTILRAADSLEPGVLVVDSVQTVYNADIASAPGSVTQVRECTMTLMRYAKTRGVTILLVGHVNKDGEIAGPKVLEHMVDTVLNFEGERNAAYRILKSEKNRFGSTHETGVFQMGDTGLTSVDNPSEALLSGRPEGAHGSCVVATLEGTRPLLAEVQALVTKSAYGSARRTASGLDYNRAVLLMAILEKRAGFLLSSFDAYINVVGGLSLDEPATDLAALLALASSYLEKPIGHDLAAFGEVGLSGELRAVTGAAQRLEELRRLGFGRCVLPEGCRESVKSVRGIQMIFARDIAEAIKSSL